MKNRLTLTAREYRMEMTVLLFCAFAALALVILPGCSTSGDDTTGSPTAVAETARYKPKGFFGLTLDYLSSNAISIPGAIPAPPANGSPEDESELATILQLQNTRTAADCQRANTEANPTFANFYGAPYGPLSNAAVSALNDFMSRVINDTHYFSSNEKNYWNRPRPYTEDSAIQPCVPLESSTSYPSGHATYAWVMAEVLSGIYPADQATFEARAAVIAQDRVMGGVHHPSDIVAGKQLAAEILAALQQNTKFQQDLSTVLHGQPL